AHIDGRPGRRNTPNRPAFAISAQHAVVQSILVDAGSDGSESRSVWGQHGIADTVGWAYSPQEGKRKKEKGKTADLKLCRFSFYLLTFPFDPGGRVLPPYS